MVDLNSLLEAGDSIGSLVGNLVETNTKLQRIVSRCGCEFYYASFDDELEEGLEAVPASNTVRKITCYKYNYAGVTFYHDYLNEFKLLMLNYWHSPSQRAR